MTYQLDSKQINYFKALADRQISRDVAESLIINYTTRVTSRKIREIKRNNLVCEVIYQLGNSGLEVGHHKGWSGTEDTFTMYDIGEGSKMLTEARASLGI